MVKAKCFCMFKNEADILEDWLLYHLAIFGDGNIHLIDDHSTDESAAILDRFQGRVTVEKSTVSASIYKGENLSRVMGRYKHECDLLIQIDADEFICLQNSAQPAQIRETFSRLNTREIGRFKFSFNYSAIPSQEDPSDPLLDLNDFRITSLEFSSKDHTELSKTFYSSAYFLCSDNGNHQGLSLNERTEHTDLWLITFPVRGRAQLEAKLCKGAIYNGFWKRFPQHSSHWRKGYTMLREGKFEEYYGYWTGSAPHARRTFFADRLRQLRNPLTETTMPPADARSAEACFAELTSLSTQVSDLLCNWVCSTPASHPCFDLPDSHPQSWVSLADDADSILRFGMLRRYNPATFIQLSSTELLPGVKEAIEPFRLRTQLSSLTNQLKPGDVVSVDSFSELEPLLPQLQPSVIVEIRRPSDSTSPRLEPLLAAEEIRDKKYWDLLFGTAELSNPIPQAPRSLWVRVID